MRIDLTTPQAPIDALVTAGVADYDPVAGRYLPPAEHAVCLTGDGSLNMAPLTRTTTLLAGHVSGVAAAFREGGGVPYEQFRPEFTAVMDGVSRGLLDGQLIHGILPLSGDLPDRLDAGIRVADIGRGTGHAMNLMARVYPARGSSRRSAWRRRLTRSRTGCGRPWPACWSRPATAPRPTS